MRYTAGNNLKLRKIWVDTLHMRTSTDENYEEKNVVKALMEFFKINCNYSQKKIEATEQSKNIAVTTSRNTTNEIDSPKKLIADDKLKDSTCERTQITESIRTVSNPVDSTNNFDFTNLGTERFYVARLSSAGR